MNDFWVGFLVGTISIGVTLILLWGFLSPRVVCPQCGSVLPRVRPPRSFRQMLWGGWTCPHCGSQVSRAGAKIKQDS
jgi:transposase-like protein